MRPNPRIFSRRLACTPGSYTANRRFAFAFAVLSVLSAKAVHIIAQHDALSTNQIGLWMYSFLGQDIAVLILIRLLLDQQIASASPNALRTPIGFLGNALLFYNLAVSLIVTIFYAITGSEVHWRNVASTRAHFMMSSFLSGIITFALIMIAGAVLSWVLQDVCFALFGFYSNVISACCSFIIRCTPCWRSRPYTKLSRHDRDDNSELARDFYDSDSEQLGGSDRGSDILTQPPIFFQYLSRWLGNAKMRVSAQKLDFAFNFVMHFLATTTILVYFGFMIARPNDGVLVFISWTAGLLPFVRFTALSPNLENIQPVYEGGIHHKWDTLTSLTDPISLPWLPTEEMSGFEDWYRHASHYSASADPLKIDNLDDSLLPELGNGLKKLDIRHVVMFFMESVRNDMFPIKKDSPVWDRLAETWPEKKLSPEIQQKLANLTPMANYITGDYDDGFDHAEQHRKRGGLRFTKYHTAGTYTLKSLPAMLCGLAPLVAEFNLDWKHHIYQPCLPHIFEALNNIAPASTLETGPYVNSKWQSYFFQTATLQFNEFDKLMSKIGFPQANTIDTEYLRSSEARHGQLTIPNTNYFGFEEEPLLPYIEDAFESAKEKDERVFLAHITSTTHHPFVLPRASQDEYVPLSRGLDELSHYINAQGYNDQWIRKFLTLLDKQGVANQTLVIFVGDHGTSLVENDIASSYNNPNVGNDHVPFVLSHPQLPAFDVDSAVSGIQILPTVLDLLLETGSLNNASREAIESLVRNYEGQSLIRPQKVFNDKWEQGNWQFTTVNPGRSQLTARDGRFPERRLVIPVLNSAKWRFSNDATDPRQEHSVQASDFKAFLHKLERKHGRGVARWAEEGGFVARYFVTENAKKWRYGPYNPLNGGAS